MSGLWVHLDVTIADGNADPDYDGAPNWKEFEKGTLPLDPDSDDGGEGDNTDIDPNNPSDDRIQATWGKAYPGVNVVHLLYVNRPDYIQIDIYRSPSATGPYTLVDSLYTGEGLYSDKTVINSQQYCYLVVAENSQGARSAPLNPSCATPSDDPFAPYGYIRINDGQAISASVNVNLTLWASDAVDPESELVFYETLFPADAPNSGVSDMMISNNPTLADASWEPYSTSKLWTLLPDNNSAKVFAKFRDANGNESDIVYSSIDIVTLDIGQCSDRPLMSATDFALLSYSHSELTNHHAKGQLAVGGNALLNKVHLNGNPRNKNANDINALVVGSNVQYNKGSVNRGNIVYAGLKQIDNVQIKGSVLQAYPIAFGIEHAQIKLRSQLWASLPTSVSAQSTLKKNGKLVLQGDDELNVFNVSPADFSGVKMIEVRASKTATVLINVTGDEVNLSGIKVKSTGIASRNILFNFAQADTLTISNADWGASILAPRATVNSADNHYRSNIIVSSIQDHNSHVSGDRFASCLPLPVAP
ncbi:choice-of-anchor A family protein [Paraglaciecola sp. MB-3u-78]|jgi:choice-of-anchor A domain-containing protein|uniref:choice-of-anchor A family protein n=1 Tax=Paraglaciecola sp. MB-3u-78 TaxID=2058332 RepID=UPI0018E2B9F2|nr:choice-of-anchor A family protein [Paraglaciecola sp. MB-3u-78]